MTPEALATFFAGNVALPCRSKGNVCASAQYIETNKHHSALTALMAQAFAPPVELTALYHYLAALFLLNATVWNDD
ncbi:hypothetical protein [Bradyrhizobium retamae]|uniref:Uncharacterized protein n=1 Tax=Bradyrhizobium retamae TaxID=1300035 RepID=A0A0R3NB97_9BRAD|nr:hypothetical protein [Bradyrhizobium retamae]KRR29636.1 hypothetical protein CQ13_38295 [Bradyrhizobium retamae]